MKLVLSIFLLSFLISKSYSQDLIRVSIPYQISESEIYESVKWKNLNSTIDYNNIDEITDSIYYDDMLDEKHMFISTEIGLKYFDLDINENLILFDELGKITGEVKFDHFEYLENMIEGGFYAIYKSINEGTDFSDCTYSLSKSSLKLIDKAYNINQKQIKNFNTDLYYSYETQDYEYEDQKYQLTLLSSEKEPIDYNNRIFDSMLLRSYNGRNDTLLSIAKQYVLLGLYTVPININDFPIFLFKIGVPDTDYIDFVTVYNDEEFQISSGVIKKINNRP
ncbi:hypothetical protein [Carboxylicivirga marina]|uniref:Uncharacterized protein n=1 Tax=Carboxylicivirga marina TaxID=2800988 RepID=A0ABS1HR18_9BACT|nr:hypothetical protein [Carboxylicivirga marina]MBK3519619.1 hypothetical protein [Carboxylicivirga marina]